MNDFEFEIPDLIGKVLPETNELKILSVIGYGSFAVVYKAEDIDGNLFAVKCIVKKGLNSFQLDLQYREAELLQSLENHPNIVNLYQVIDTEENLFFVLDLCECDLFEAIVHNHGFGNEYTKEVFEILIDTVQYLHDRNIYHRDLKPENILITADGDIKIADFGLACSDKWSKDFECGTLRYEPPECIDPSSKGYCPEKSDLWALGVILVNLRFERNPWAYASSEDNIYYEFSTNNSNILQQQLGLSNEMNNILKNIFKVDPNKRWSLSQLKEAIFDIDEMYDDSKYNPLPPKKSNYSSPIPITPNSRKGSKFTYNFSSTNSSTFNNSPRFVKQYEDNMESGYYVNDENEFTFHDKTYINSKYDDYFLNHHSLSHFSFCSRNEEEDDDYEEEEEEEEEIVDDEVLENDSEIEDENEEIKKRKGKPLFHCKLPRDIEIETFYLEDELCTTNDNRLYRSIKKGSICSRHSPSIRSNESCGSIRFLHDSKHAHKNKHIHRNDESHVIRPTPLRINTSLFYAEDETSSTVKVPEETKKQKSPEKFSSINKKISLEHEIPESWEDYSFDDVLSDIPLEDEEEKEFESKVKIESTPNPKSKLISKVEPEQHLKVVFPQLRKSPLKNSQTVSKDRVIMSKIYSDKIASFYKDQLIWSPRVTNREERDCEEEEKINELKLLPESVNSQPEEIKGSNPKEALNNNVNCNSIVKKEEIKNFSFVSFYLGILKEKKNEISYYWKACSFFSKHALSVHFNEISLLNINLIWMSYQPTSYSFLMKYYIPQFPLYIFIFSYQLIERIKKLPQYSLYPQNLEMEIMNKRNNKEIRKYYFQKPWNKNQLKTIVKAPFSFKTNKKEKRLIVRPNNNMLFRPMKMSKQLNHSILTFFNKILNIFIDLYEFSVNYKSTHYRPDIKIKTINILKTIVFNYQGIVNNTLHPISKDSNEYGFDYEKSVPYIPNQISPHMNSLVKLASNDLAIWTTMTSLENIFSFFVEKLNLSFLMMFISSFQSKFFLVSEISYKNFNFLKFTNNFIIFLNQFFSKCISIKN